MQNLCNNRFNSPYTAVNSSIQNKDILVFCERRFFKPRFGSIQKSELCHINPLTFLVLICLHWRNYFFFQQRCGLYRHFTIWFVRGKRHEKGRLGGEKITLCVLLMVLFLASSYNAISNPDPVEHTAIVL